MRKQRRCAGGKQRGGQHLLRLCLQRRAHGGLIMGNLKTVGQLCEELNDLKAAEEHYQEVLEADYNYRDTLAIPGTGTDPPT